jgi:hypothetical protein
VTPKTGGWAACCDDAADFFATEPVVVGTFVAATGCPVAWASASVRSRSEIDLIGRQRCLRSRRRHIMQEEQPDTRTAVEATAKPASASLAMYRLLVTLVPTGPIRTTGKLAKPKPPDLALPSPSIVYKKANLKVTSLC